MKKSILRSLEATYLFLSLLTFYPGFHQWNDFIKLVFWFSIYGMLAVSGIDISLFIRSKTIVRERFRSRLSYCNHFHVNGVCLPLVIFTVVFIAGRQTDFILTGIAVFFVIVSAEVTYTCAYAILGETWDKKSK